MSFAYEVIEAITKIWDTKISISYGKNGVKLSLVPPKTLESVDERLKKSMEHDKI